MAVHLQITLTLEKFSIRELIEVSQSARHSNVRFRRRLSSVGPTVVFKPANIEQVNDYLMVYCRKGPTISTLAYTFVLPSLQFSASVGNINISLAYTGLPDGL